MKGDNRLKKLTAQKANSQKRSNLKAVQIGRQARLSRSQKETA